MCPARESKPKLTLIHGSLTEKISLGELLIGVSPKEAPPFAVDAFVFEEDTFLVMSADTTVRDPKVPLVRIMSNLIETQPEVPGTVLVRGGPSLRFLAVVYDFNEDPSLREEWVAGALKGIFHESEKREIGSLALPWFGATYGLLTAERFAELLGHALASASLRSLNRLWLIVPPGNARHLTDMLKLLNKGDQP